MPLLSVRTAVTQRPDCVNIKEEPRKRIGPSRVKELAKFFTPSSDEEDQSCVNNRMRRKRLFKSEEKEGESEKK